MSPGSGDNPLVIRKLEFLGGMSAKGGWRPASSLPEIAFVGRSNVGKSSLLNTLVGRRNFARVSRTPGRTREINFFRVNDSFVLADLPGYGYARVSKEHKANWRPLLEGYLKHSSQLKGVVHLLDVRHAPSEEDQMMLDLLAELEMPTIVVLTKRDKLSKTAAAERAGAIGRELDLDPDQTILFSSLTGEGRNELASAIVNAIAGDRA